MNIPILYSALVIRIRLCMKVNLVSYFQTNRSFDVYLI